MIFMLLSKLFQRDGVECPKWLKHILIEDYWINSDYSNEDNTHKWVFKNQLVNLLITFDEKEYLFIAFDKSGSVIFERIVTPEYEIIS